MASEEGTRVAFRVLDEEPETKRVLPRRSAPSGAGSQGGYRPPGALQELNESRATDRTFLTSEGATPKRNEAKEKAEGRVNFQQSEAT